MHILEIILFVLSFLLFGITVQKGRLNILSMIIIYLSILLAFILHVVIDGLSWRLYPLYISLVILIIAGYFINIKNIEPKKIVTKLVRIFTSIFLLLSLILALIFPFYKLPVPEGDYNIGTQSFVVQDPSRPEIYTSDPSDTRRIKIQIWYPAESVEGYEKVPWLQDGIILSRALSQDFGFPSFVLDQTSDVMSNSYQNAPINTDYNRYPIIIISHGWRGFRDLHTDFAEELASQGYIVVSIDHTYGSIATVFGENDVAYLNKDALPDRESTDDFIDYANKLVSTYGEDVTTTINFLEQIESGAESSNLTGKLDMTKIGVLGHSTGGGGDVMAALNDDRIDALIGLDAWVEPIDKAEIDKELSIPSLFLRSGQWETGINNTNLYDLVENSKESSVLYQVEGTTHFDFAMVYMYSPLIKVIGFSGDVNNKDLTSMLKQVIVGFFDKTLRNSLDSDVKPDSWDYVRIIKSNS